MMQTETRAHVIAWINHAEKDLQAMRLDMSADPPLLDDALFHCEQVIEKSLVALLVAAEKPIERTHDLEKLADSCLEIEPGVSELRPKLGRYAVYADLFRDPVEAPPATPHEAGAGALAAMEIFEMTLKRITQMLSE